MTQPTLALQGFFLRRCQLDVERLPYEIRIADQAAPGAIHYDIAVNYNAKPLNDQDVHLVECKAEVKANWGEQKVMVGELVFEMVVEAKGFEPATLAQVLGQFCPNQAVPYVRHMLQFITQSTGFQPVVLPLFVAPPPQPQPADGTSLPAGGAPAALPDYTPRKLH